MCDDCKTHFYTVQQLLKKEGVKFAIAPHLVRGLDYYTKTVFEFEHEGFDGKTLTIAAGGRYDNLVAEIGGKSCCAIGVGIGLDRLKTLIPSNMINSEPLYYIANTDEVQLDDIISIAEKLRNSGLRVEINLANRSFKAQMKYANNINADFLIVLGSNEIKTRSASIKNLKTGEILEQKINF